MALSLGGIPPLRMCILGLGVIVVILLLFSSLYSVNTPISYFPHYDSSLPSCPLSITHSPSPLGLLAGGSFDATCASSLLLTSCSYRPDSPHMLFSTSPDITFDALKAQMGLSNVSVACTLNYGVTILGLESLVSNSPSNVHLFIHVERDFSTSLLSVSLLEKLDFLVFFGHSNHMELRKFLSLSDHRFPAYRIYSSHQSVQLILSPSTTLLSSTTASCRSGNRYAVVSVNDAVSYAFYLPLLFSTWYHVTGMHLLVTFSGPLWVNVIAASSVDELSTKEEKALRVIYDALLSYRVRFGRTVFLESVMPATPIDAVAMPQFTVRLGQLSRLFSAAHPELREDDYLLLADSDILPLRYNYFRGTNPSKALHIFNHDCCGHFSTVDRREADTTVKQIRHFAMSYVGATVATWRQLHFPSVAIPTHPFSLSPDSRNLQTTNVFVDPKKPTVPFSIPCISLLTQYRDLHSLVWSAASQAIHVETDDLYLRVAHRRRVPFESERLWFLDELILSKRIQDWDGYPDHVDFRNGPVGRFDRSDHTKWTSSQPLGDDSHLWRDGFLDNRWGRIAAVVRRALPLKEWETLDRFRKTFMQVKE